MKPLEIKLKYGFIIGFIAIVITLFGVVEKGEKFLLYITPNQNLLNWRFFTAMILMGMLAVWIVLNRYWWKEFEAHQKTKFEKENFEMELKKLENERLTDVITGIPNTMSLQKDIDTHLKKRRESRQMQFILIDLKSFGKINNKYGFIKTNELLRTIAQTIYQRMRRNEEMYKYPINENLNLSKEGFYRIHAGGDEFVFLIEGDQSDAVGFCNRLVYQFNNLSKMTPEILGNTVDLSFHCAIVNMSPRDNFEDVFGKAQECYRLAKEGKENFTICWHPNSFENTLVKDPRKKISYEKARDLFEVMTIPDKNYS